MRSPWVDLLFLHGHASPGTLKWLPDETAACRCQTEQVQVDVALLPLPACTEHRADCDPCSA
ncbi:hypothetical protein [Dyella acidiphila]|uniref:Uncharacterized protein n=1 Tax=Dyella acidiphila TaxID=2775866 RepID=A0ABR9G5T7_9GAMM|nr:hypothetical protein [Dyella acidiphila]MBE1159416.1 hypothetical protein [Dyella acidiphila]